DGHRGAALGHGSCTSCLTIIILITSIAAHVPALSSHRSGPPLREVRVPFAPPHLATLRPQRADEEVLRPLARSDRAPARLRPGAAHHRPPRDRGGRRRDPRPRREDLRGNPLWPGRTTSEA